jgi:putative sterol carrier protein
MSYINLYAVLRNIEELVKLDEISAEQIKGKNISIQFIVKNGPAGVLSFKDGKAEMKRGRGKADISLYFTSPNHFNKMMDGKANPIPLKGFTRISFLTKNFMKLAERLEFYLRADDELLKDPAIYKANTEMTAYTAFFALSEIANRDEMSRHNADTVPEGIIQVKVGNGPSVMVTKKDGRFSTEKGLADDPRCILSFQNLETVHQVLKGKLDSFTAIATGEMEMKGFIPMIENMNPILDQVAVYLS